MKDQLKSFLKKNGVSDEKAEIAARNCAAAVARNGAGGLVAGTAFGVAMRNPAALFMGMALGTFTGGYALAKSSSCEEVQEAADKWISGGFGLLGE